MLLLPFEVAPLWSSLYLELSLGVLLLLSSLSLSPFELAFPPSFAVLWPSLLLDEGFKLDILLEDTLLEEDGPKVVAGSELGAELERLVGAALLGIEEVASELLAGRELGSNELGARDLVNSVV